MLQPIVPHIAHTLWQTLRGSDDVLAQRWPLVDEAALVRDQITLVVQVNGKLRGSISVPASADKETIIAAAKADTNVARFIAGQTIKKQIVVPDRTSTRLNASH